MTDASPVPEERGMIFLFGPERFETRATFRPVYESPAVSLNLSSERHEVHVNYENGLVHRYDFDGTFLDAAKWETEMLEYLNGYGLVNLAESKLAANTGEGPGFLMEVTSLYDRALAKGVSQWTQAKIHRSLGEICLRLDDPRNAVKHFEEAIRQNPKVGVKKELERIRKLL
ncbi:MAG: hypothetical protein WCA95_03615 [Opitutaceae bacterium]